MIPIFPNQPDAQSTSEKNQPNGYAGLDANGVIPPAQIPPVALTSDDISNDSTVTGATVTDALDELDNKTDFVGPIGINTPSAPARQLEVYHATENQIRVSGPGGRWAELGVSATGDISIAGGPTTTERTSVGTSATASGGRSTALGANSTASGFASTASGAFSTASGANSTASGASSTASGANSTASGASSTTATTATGSIASGSNAQVTLPNTSVQGSNAHPINTFFCGKGESNPSPTMWSARGTSGFGTDVKGGDISIDAGAGTGTGDSGIGHLRATNIAATGTTLQSSWKNLISWNRTGVGFHGAAPVGRQVLPPVLVDDTGGTPLTTLPEIDLDAITIDAATKAAISALTDCVASLATQVAALQAKLVDTTLVEQGV